LAKRGEAKTTRAALDAWVLRTAARAVAYATSLLRDPVQAEDVVQDCYCRLLRKAAVYDLPRDGVKLLFKAISNACINVCTRRPPVVSIGSRAEDDGRAWETEDQRTQPPDQILMFRELEQAVRDGLARLPVQQRAALQLKSLGHSQQEIAESLNTTTTNAGVLVHRARQAMADYLAVYVGEAAG
jgi:RNA polymerase sigma factor (sigma-70 family)